jgi:hypothetical protein
MRRVCSLSLALWLAAPLAALAADAVAGNIIDFPCSKNLADGRVLVDGTLWDAKMRALGHVLEDGAYVPYDVLRFSQLTVHDALWADGMCRIRLLPVTK